MIISKRHFYELLDFAKQSADYISNSSNHIYIEFWLHNKGYSYQHNATFEFSDILHAKPVRVTTLIFEYKQSSGKLKLINRLPVVTCWVHNAQTFQLSNLCYIQKENQ